MKTFCKIISLLFFLLMLYSSSIVQSQNDELEFIRIRPVSEGYTVYFDLKAVKSESHAEAILQSIIDDTEAYDGRYFRTRDNNDRIQLFYIERINATQVRDILLKHDTDYVFSHVSINGEVPNSSKNIQRSSIQGERVPVEYEDFPVFINTGNPEKDAIEYKNKKKQWIENNPEKYKKLLENMRSN